MANATTNNSTGDHSGHWQLTVDRAHTKDKPLELLTGGKFVDRNIDIIVPAAEETVSGTASATVAVTVGNKANGKYPFSGSKDIDGTATAHVAENKSGFIAAGDYTGAVTGTANVSGSMNAIGLSASGSGSATIDTVNIGDKGTNGYAITGSATGTGTASATISTTGYGKAGVETGSGTTSVTANLNSTIPAAAATISLSAQATSPTVAKDSTTNVLSQAATTTKPGSGYYVAVKGTAPATSLTPSITIGTAGYLGNEEEISASGTTTAKTGSTYYVPITSSSLGNTAKSGVTYAENTTVTIPSKGALYIEGGYIPATMITLDQMLDGKTDTAGTANTHILDGYVAYSVDGEKLTGSMPNNGATGATITTQNGTYTIPAGYTTGGTVTATLPTQTLPTAAVTTNSNTIQGTVSRSTSDQYIIIPTGYNDTQVAYKINKTPNAGAATTKPTAVTTEVTVGTAASGYYPLTNTIGATTSHASAGWVGTSAETGSASIQVGKIAQSNLKDGTTTVSSGYTIPAGNTVTIAAGYYDTARTVTAQAKSASQNITGSLSTSITTGYTAPTLVGTPVSGTPYVTIVGNGSMTAGNIYSGTANAKTQYLEVYNGTYTVN